jgi:hypothetical protein
MGGVLAFLGLDLLCRQIDLGRCSFAIEREEETLVFVEHHPLDLSKEDWMILPLYLSFTRDA